MQNLLEDLRLLLTKDQRFVIDGKLLKNKVIECALNLDADLISLLLQNDTIKKHFFQPVGEVLVFDKVKFQKFVSNKQFLPDSYTAFKNKIGLISGDEFIADKKEVVLAWPYKDCVLEGGQTKEDQKRSEIFWSETLAPEEIDRLLSPKVFSDFKKYSYEGVFEVNELNANENYILKGNNLLTLHSLSRIKSIKGKIKLIYIDPPYNTGSDSFGYNDNFNHSSWLTFFKNRIKIASELLSKEGSIWINLDDAESHYAKIICDEIFGRENFVANVIWQKKYAPQNDAKFFSDNHDHILVYAKNIQSFKLNLLPRSSEMDKRYKNVDNDPRGSWTSDNLLVKTYSKDYDYPITNPAGRVINPPNGSCWRVSKEKFELLKADNRIWFGENGTNVPRLKRFLSEVQQGLTPLTIWPYNEVGHNQDARRELFELVDTNIFKTPKPEKLIKRVIELGSNEGDYVLDFFAGSGTTAAVALKMNRHFITCEQMDYCEDVTIERLKKVLAGEQGGISEDVTWKGGGSFIYCSMFKSGQHFMDKILKAKDSSELSIIANELLISNLIRVEVLSSKWELAEFTSLNFNDQKKVLLDLIDKNDLYLPLSEINDTEYNISTRLKDLNYAFYKI